MGVRIRDALAGQNPKAVAAQVRTVGALLAGAEPRRKERKHQQAQERERLRQEETASRAAYLNDLARRQDEAWWNGRKEMGLSRPS